MGKGKLETLGLGDGVGHFIAEEEPKKLLLQSFHSTIVILDCSVSSSAIIHKQLKPDFELLNMLCQCISPLSY